MRAVRLCFWQMLASMRRDMMLFAACVAPVLAGIVFKYAVPLMEAALTGWLNTSAVLAPYYRLMDVFLAMLSPAMLCFASAMIALEERDEGTARYLFVTPLGKSGYLAAHFGLTAAVALAATAVLLALFKLSPLSLGEMALLAVGGTLQGQIAALLMLTLSGNKLEGMAVAKLASLSLCGAAAPFFIRNDIQYLMSPLPAFWMGKAICEGAPLYMLAALLLSLVWIGLLLRRYLRGL